MPLDVLGIDIPAHLRDRMKSLHEDRMQQLLVRGVSAEERRQFIAKLRAIDARRSKPATPEEIEKMEDDYIGVEPDDEEEEDEDELEREQEEEEEEEEGEESEEVERLKPDYQHREKEPSEADSDAVSPVRRGSHTRLMIERKLRRLAKSYASRHAVSYSQAYAHIMLHTEEGRRLGELYSMASPHEF